MTKIWHKIPYQSYWVEESNGDVVKTYRAPRLDWDAMREFAKKELNITAHLDFEAHIKPPLLGFCALVTTDGDIGILSNKPL